MELESKGLFEGPVCLCSWLRALDCQLGKRLERGLVQVFKARGNTGISQEEVAPLLVAEIVRGWPSFPGKLINSVLERSPLFEKDVNGNWRLRNDKGQDASEGRTPTRVRYRPRPKA